MLVLNFAYVAARRPVNFRCNGTLTSVYNRGKGQRSVEDEESSWIIPVGMDL
jgi:hypothetical protein